MEPKGRTLTKTERNASLSLMEEALEAMIVDDEEISARGLVWRMGGVFKHATDVTRPTDRRSMLEHYQARQLELRRIISKADKTSKANLSAQIARKDEEIEELTRQRDLLVASHRAMILAVGEIGGMKAWRRFFDGYQTVLDELRALGALPAAEIAQSPTKSSTKLRSAASKNLTKGCPQLVAHPDGGE